LNLILGLEDEDKREIAMMNSNREGNEGNFAACVAKQLSQQQKQGEPPKVKTTTTITKGPPVQQLQNKKTETSKTNNWQDW
jgi:hypothetical protein